MDKDNYISKEALRHVARLIHQLLDDSKAVAVVSPHIAYVALKIGLKISPPAAQAISILLMTLGRACLEQLVAGNISKGHRENDAYESAKCPAGSHLPASEEVH